MIIYQILRPLATIFIKLCYRPQIIGKENIDSYGPLIFVCNHTSKLDAILLMGSTNRRLYFLGKHTLFKGLRKYFFKALGVIPVNRTIKDKSVIPKSIKVLEAGQALAIFPESTINRTRDLILPFKIGAVKIGATTKTKLIPVVINGKYKIFDKDLKLKFLKPMMITTNDLTKANEMLMNIFKKELKVVKE